MIDLDPSLSPSDHIVDNDERVSISKIAQITGYEIEFIKKELCLDRTFISLGDLREAILHYLEKFNDGRSSASPF